MECFQRMLGFELDLEPKVKLMYMFLSELNLSFFLLNSFWKQF